MEMKKEAGQTVVEYILLLAVAVSLILTFYHNQAFKRLFGDKGTVGMRIKRESEFSYRHAFGVDYASKAPPVDISPANRNISVHPSYRDPKNGGTRFFGPREAYE